MIFEYNNKQTNKKHKKKFAVFVMFFGGGEKGHGRVEKKGAYKNTMVKLIDCSICVYLDVYCHFSRSSFF